MNIAKAARLAGMPVKTLRYYEEIGLVQPARAEGNSYRQYTEADVQLLRFLSDCRASNLGLNQIRQLLGLFRAQGEQFGAERALVIESLEQIGAQLLGLQRLRQTLETMLESGEVKEEVAEVAVVKVSGNGMAFLLVER